MCDRHGSGLGAVIQHLFSETAVLPAQPAEARATMRRMKLWELDDKLHCPVIGTCLKLDEIKKIARKSGFEGGGVDEYRLHVEAVSVSCTRNPASEAMQKLLDRKFERYLRRFEKARSPDEVRVLWRQHLEQGEVPGGMWTALACKAADRESRQQVYADVHMLSHQVGAGQAADLRRLEWLEREQARLAAELRDTKARHVRDRALHDGRLRQWAAEVEAERRGARESSPLRQCVEELESGVAMTGMARRLLALADENVRLTDRNGDLGHRVADLEAMLSGLRNDLDQALRERDALERLWLSESAAVDACDGRCDSCSNPLSGRCVLCVGGRTTLLPQYRQLAERLGVRLIHHDGGREESLSRLPAMLASSEAVICPTDCVGHLAYYQLKQHCKQAGKPCVLIKRSGIASFAAALTRLDEGRTEIQAD